VSDSKTCRKCGEAKPLSAFHREKRVKDGRKSTCAECGRKASAEWRESNRDHLTTYHKEDAQRRKTYQREWRAANPDKIRAYRQTYQSKADTHDFLTQWRKAHG
jgi:hypothetical protein